MLSAAIGRPWAEYDVSHIARFIAALAYNGVELKYLPKPKMDFDEYMAQKSSLVPMQNAALEARSFSEKSFVDFFNFTGLMLFYRLISSAEVLKVLCKRVNKLQAIKIGERTFSDDGDIMKYTVYV